MTIRAGWPLIQPQPRLSILIYHRVLSEADPMRPDDPDVETFDRQMRLLARYTRVMALDEAIERLERGDLPRGATAITFDDGYADNYSNALPILQRHGLSATFFVATGFLNGGRMFNDTIIEAVNRAGDGGIHLGELGLGHVPTSGTATRYYAMERITQAVKHLPAQARQQALELLLERVGVPVEGGSPMMTDAQVRELHEAGMLIGAHTVSHTILRRLDDATALREISDSRDYLSGLLRQPVRFFAYPNGRPGQDYGPRETRLARALGFRAALCIARGGAAPGSDLYQLPRYTPHSPSPVKFLAQLMRCSREEAQAVF